MNYKVNYLTLLLATSISSSVLAQTSLPAKTASFQLTKNDWQYLPFAENLTDLSLLLPGTILADTRIGYLTSIQGKAATDNQYFLDGVEIGNSITSLQPSLIPVSLLNTVSLNNSALHSSFSDSSGPRIDLTSRDFSEGITLSLNARYSDKSNHKYLRVYDPYFTDSANSVAFDVFNSGSFFNNQLSYKLHYSGQSQKDNQSVYRNDTQARIDTLTNTELNSDPETFYGSVRGILFDDHTITLTGFKDKNKSELSSNTLDVITNKDINNIVSNRGGHWVNFAYEWQISESIQLIATHKTQELSHEDIDPSGCDSIFDYTVIPYRQIGCASLYESPLYQSKEKSNTIQADIKLGQHQVTIGFKNSELTHSNFQNKESYFKIIDADGLNARYPSDGPFDQDLKFASRFLLGGSVIREYANDKKTLFINDNWQISKAIQVNLGLNATQETFTNERYTDDVIPLFTEYGNADNDYNISPTLSVDWHLMDDKNTSFNVSASRQYDSIPTSLIQGTANRYFSDLNISSPYWRVTNGVDSDGNLDLGDVAAFSIVDYNGNYPIALHAFMDKIESPYSNQLSASMNRVVFSDWNLNLTYTFDDIQNPLALFNIENQVEAGTGWYNNIIGNAGTSGYRTTREFGITKISLPELTRTNHAIVAQLTKRTPTYYINASYQWLRSNGNYEGLTASRSSLFEYGHRLAPNYYTSEPYAEGLLPNNRSHVIKFNGYYHLQENLTLGASARFYSGVPTTSSNMADPIDPSVVYDETTDAFGEIDLKVTYKMQFDLVDINIDFSILNVLDSSTALRDDLRFRPDRLNGSTRFGSPNEASQFQSERSGQIKVTIDF